MEHVYTFPGSQKYPNYVRVIIIAGTLVLAAGAGVSAATTSLHIQKTDGMGNVLSDKYVDYTWMETNLPVYGDGTTHYYHQGPVFVDNADDRWNAAEDKFRHSATNTLLWSNKHHWLQYFSFRSL